MPSRRRFSRRRLQPAALIAALALAVPAAAAAAPYAPGHIVLGFRPHTSPAARAAALRAAGARGVRHTGQERLVALAPGADPAAAAAQARANAAVAYAVPDFTARASDTGPTGPSGATGPKAPPFIPNDPGLAHTPGGWQGVQWNFTGPFGVNAPQAWGNLIAAGAPGGRGVLVAVLDTGVAYLNRGPFRRSPDFDANQFTMGYDFVSHSHYPVDRLGHGTHVAGTIAEATDNGVGVTGLAYGVKIMPVRVLDATGSGAASTIAAGIRYATNHHAQIINLSLEFPTDLTAADVPELLSAIAYAHRRGVLLAAASGNEGDSQIPYPAHARYVIAVGATTEHGCLSDFSNYGKGMSLVAPGGGSDASFSDDANCHPSEPPGRDIYQMTLTGSSPRAFAVTADGYEGTSMATPHVSATAALVIASGILGPHPAPDAVYARLRSTARDLGYPGYDQRYGFGLIDAAAATDPAVRTSP